LIINFEKWIHVSLFEILTLYIRPCKARKVKCDETHPSCFNCQRVGEACDYSIRLNWEGRGKRKTEDDSQAVFPSGTSNTRLGISGTGGTQLPKDEMYNAAKEQESNLSIQGIRGPRTNTTDPTVTTPAYIGYSPVDPPQQSPKFTHYHSQSSPDTAAIDPALTSYPNIVVPDYHEESYNRILGRPDQLYTQSYERYHPASESVSRVLYQPALAMVRDVPTHQNEFPAPPNAKQTHSSLLIEARSVGDDNCFDRPSKRGRYDYPGQEGGGPAFLDMPPYPLLNPHFSTNTTPTAPAFPMSIPLTPASSLTDSEDGYKTYPAKMLPHTTHEPPDPRRLSVESLLSRPPEIPHQHSRAYGSVPTFDTQTHISTPSGSDMTDEMATWGVDRGFPDLDIGRNDDVNSISGGSPLMGRDNLDLARNEQGDFAPTEFGFGVQAKIAEFQKGNYYARSAIVCYSK
jgi:Fungal Zn(2)-Cys(6) binuclear cluster domain